MIAKDANREQKGEFLAVVQGTLRRLADQGLNKKSLLAAINYYEFRSREADFGSFPKGLMYGLQCLDSWLYEGDPLLYLEYEEAFAFLKKSIEEGYFEDLIRTWMLDNPSTAVILVSPKKNMTAEEDKKLEEKLAAYRETLTQEQRTALAQATKELKEYQDAPSPKEDLEKIPLLRREDINPEPEKLILEEREEEGVKVLFHNIFTSGIGYVKVLFNTDRIPQEDMVYAGLLKAVLGAVSTKHYSYGELADEINLNSGGVNFSIVSYPSLEDPDQFTGMFAGTARVLYEKLDFGFSILGEILTTSVLDDEKRLLELVNETKSRAQMRLNSAGHSAAVARATSYFSPSSAYGDVTGGIAFYQFLEDLAKNFEERKKTLIEKLKETAKRLFTTDNLTVSFTADEKGYGEMKQSLKLLTGILPETGGERYTFTCDKENKNEGFMTSSQVNYVARCGSFAESGLPYTGALRTLKVILGYDYLWLNVRVKGGAYGVMNGAGRTGEGYFVSYRDPNLKETNQVFENVVKYLEEFDADERDMTKYVIGTISDLDVPLLAPYKGSKADAAYFSHLTDEMIKKEREEILKATKEDIRALAPVIREILSTGSFCVIGNAEKIRENQELFGEVKNLFN